MFDQNANHAIAIFALIACLQGHIAAASDQRTPRHSDPPSQSKRIDGQMIDGFGDLDLINLKRWKVEESDIHGQWSLFCAQRTIPIPLRSP